MQEAKIDRMIEFLTSPKQLSDKDLAAAVSDATHTPHHAVPTSVLRVAPACACVCTRTVDALSVAGCVRWDEMQDEMQYSSWHECMAHLHAGDVRVMTDVCSLLSLARVLH